MVTSDTRPPQLVVIEPGERAGLVLPLTGAQLVIGRSASADVVVDDQFVSGRHARVTVDSAGRVTIEDLDSTSGTFVNDDRITGDRVLAAGDLVRMADLVARFEPASIEPASAESADAATEVLRALPVGADGALAYTVTGVVTSPVLPAFGGLGVQLVDRNVGGDEVLASTRTGSDGHYSIGPITVPAAYLTEHHKAEPDLQVHVSAGDGVLASSDVVYSAPPSVTLDVELPANAKGLPSEYEILTANLTAVYPGSLRTLRDSDGGQDITYLASKTGWDAKVVALAVLADRFGQLTALAPSMGADPGKTAAWPVPVVSLRPEFYYALFRAGLPASEDALFRASPAGVQAVWEKTTSQGVIPAALAGQVPQAVQTFQALSAANLLTAAPAAGISTLDEMLRGVLPETAQREAFARLYVQHQGDWPAFWAAIERQAGTVATGKLRLLGQLHHLTVNNEPLVTALLAAEADPPLESTTDLAARGYYDAAKWAPLIGAAITPSVPGADANEQAANYAELLAAQVRLSFPTTTVAGQILAGVIPVIGGVDTADLVAAFLTQNQGTFEIGAEPVQAYLARTGQTGIPPEVVAQVSRLQRVYQMTPDDTSMTMLLRHDLDSAFAVTRYDAAGFTRAFADKLGGAEVAAAVHARARQIFASTLAITAAYLGGRISPTLGGRNPFLHGYPPMTSAPTYPVVAYPTLENLFGSLDYCDCQDCGSILSPAAYLVDLLHYLDQPAPAGGRANPQDVLLGTASLPGRRPDLQYLPLTCANTNTALPYIDLVNETLEYFVANGLSLDGCQGHDTGDAITSAELVASPQYVDDAAYATLEQAFFPPPLPFSRPLMLLRLHLAKLGLTLPDAMTALRAGDQLTNGGTPVSYGWSDILIERLGISRDEYRLFTDSSLSLGDLWGLPVTAPPGDPQPPSPLSVLQMTSLAEFSRRLGLSYDDLSAIIQTEYINPNAALIPRLARLNAPFATLKALHDDPASNTASFINALPAGLDATEYGGTTPNDLGAVVAWVTDPVRYPRIMDIITITAPAGSGGDCSGADLQFRYSNPDVGANLLTADDFTRLIRFIRLWQKLSPLLGDTSNAASIRHTDAILSALTPLTPNSPGPIPRPPAMLRLGILFQVMDLLGLTGASLDQLLACWASIGVGPGSPYERMFLTPALLQQDLGAQTATVGPQVNEGDVLVTTINGEQVSSYAVLAADPPAKTATVTATAITQAINAATVPDPASQQPMNSRFYATSAGNVITIKAGFTLACTPADHYTAAAQSPLVQTATVYGPLTVGTTLTTTIDTIAISYPVQAGDTPQIAAAAAAAAVNATTIQDPYSGLALNALVVATSTGNVITISTMNAAVPFDLACEITPAQVGSYVAVPPPSHTANVPSGTAMITDPIPAGATLTTTINDVPLVRIAGSNDTAAMLAADIAGDINAATTVDAVTGLKVNVVVQAAAVSSIVVISSRNPSMSFTLSASLSPSTYTAGRVAPPFADNGYGGFLTDASQTLFAHQPTICAACNLSSAEFTLIAAELGFGPAIALTLPNVSAVFRFGWLAHTLGLSVLEFLRLREFTGLDPFVPLDPSEVTPVEPPAIRFLRLLKAISGAGLSTAQALYLMWNQDISGKSAPTASDITGLASALRADFAAAEAQFTLRDDPDGKIAQSLMTLVYGATATGYFFGLLNATTTTSVTCSGPPGQPALPTPALPQPVIAAAKGQLSYSDLTKQLSYAGLLDAATLALIEAAITVDTTDGTDNVAAANAVMFTPASMAGIYPGAALVIDTGPAQEHVVITVTTATTFTADTKQSHDGHSTPFRITSDPALPTALAGLANASQQAAAPFFATYPELQLLYTAYAASADPVQAKRTALLDNFIPILKGRRKAEQALAAVTAAAGTDPNYASTLLQDLSILHADSDVTAPAINDLTAIEAQGLTASFFLSNDPGSVADQMTDAVPALRYARTATIAGTFTSGDVLTTTINGVPILYTVVATDASPEQVAGNVAARINAMTSTDTGTSFPINQVVSATASGSVVTIAGRDPSGAHSYCSLTAASSAAALTYVAGTQLPTKPGGGPIAGTWSGYISVPQDGFYDVAVAADPAASIALRIGTVTVNGAINAGVWRNQSPVSLVAGQLTPITLTATSLTTTLSVSWQSASLGWQVIPGQCLYSSSLVSRLTDTYIRFLKATSLATALSLTAPDLAYLAIFPASGAWLNLLASTPDAATGAALCAALTDLLDFSRIKLALSPADERLLAVLQNPAAVLPNGQYGLLSLTGWSQESVYALLTWFYGSPDLTSIRTVRDFSQVYDAFTVVRACGLPAATLTSAVTNAPTAATVTTLQSALRARYAEQDWLTAVRPINDAARVRQRDALVAYILQQLGDRYAQSVIPLTTSAPAAIGATTVNCTSVAGVSSGMLVHGAAIAPGTSVTAVAAGAITLSAGILADMAAGTALSAAPYATAFESADSLLEYFLVDVQTQPPVLTSRIRLALSQIQLFIERVIRNLEPQVSAADIDVTRWQWMKRYRLWQANREVFLWPENWLYPELRDNPSPLFQQMMSTLLQGDVTDDAAASGYLDYLTSLEEVAKLEPCGLYYQPGSTDTSEVSYVVARTAGAHRKHYFRQLRDGSWTPWTQVMIDCEDMPLTSVVWNGRLFLFWLKMVKQGQPPQTQITPATGTPDKTALGNLLVSDLNNYVKAAGDAATAKSAVVQGVLCWTEFYNGKWQPTKTSDVNLPTTIGTFDLTGNGSFEAIRNQARIIPTPFTGSNPAIAKANVQFSLPNDALVLAITVDTFPSFGGPPKPPAVSGGFVLHNTHSLPIRFDDIKLSGSNNSTLGLPEILDLSATARFFYPALQVPYTGTFMGNDFQILYGSVSGFAFNDILTFSWQPRVVHPQTVPDVWAAPFIYEDRRNLFYVTTAHWQIPIGSFQGFGRLALGAVSANGGKKE